MIRVATTYRICSPPTFWTVSSSTPNDPVLAAVELLKGRVDQVHFLNQIVLQDATEGLSDEVTS
jgi:hypothetical protein